MSRYQKTLTLLLLGCFLTLQACTQHQIEVKPLEIKPIHITIDVNIKVDRALDNFFGDLDKIEKE
ncbi:YnbE family lipoprotein [Desulfotalea psychrophila]|uniref:YnbE family lipoprotein n=1 Tax=Desulfotalea psychrophila TaxID=84980 RepID=UPI0002FEEA6E|nr:YnbE family lipoprotein [Desulfotalea psychrophila]